VVAGRCIGVRGPAGRCTVVFVALLRCTVGVAVSTPLAGAGVAGVLACCDLVALVRCAGVVRGVVSAGVESPGCVGGCAADFLAAVVVLLVRGAERVRGAVSDGAAEAVLAVSATFWAGATVAPLAEVAVADVDVVRRLAAGLTSCSELSGLPGKVLSVLERVLDRLLVVAGFTCSSVLALVSGDSDVFLMKKTPFYRMVRLKRRRKSLFTATKKYCRLLR
jgi:hypothetical protein